MLLDKKGQTRSKFWFRTKIKSFQSGLTKIKIFKDGLKPKTYAVSGPSGATAPNPHTLWVEPAGGEKDTLPRSDRSEFVTKRGGGPGRDGVSAASRPASFSG